MISGLVVGFPGRRMNFVPACVSDDKVVVTLPQGVDQESTVRRRAGCTVLETQFEGGQSIRVERGASGTEKVVWANKDGRFRLELPGTTSLTFIGPEENLALSQSNFQAVVAPGGELNWLVVDRCFTSALGDGTWGSEVRVNGSANRIELRDYRERAWRMQPVTGKWQVEVAEGARIHTLEIHNELGQMSGILNLKLRVVGTMSRVTVRLQGTTTVNSVDLVLDGTDPDNPIKAVGGGCSIGMIKRAGDGVEILLTDFALCGQNA